MSAPITATTVIAAVSAAATVAGTAYSIVSATGAKAPSVDTSAATGEVNQAATTAAAQRTQLLETAGGSQGETLSSGQVSNSKNTIFGN